MPITIAPERLEALVGRVLSRTSCDADEAALIAHYLVDADLAGHDSHGVMRTSRYVTWLETGMMVAGRKIKVVSENPAFAVLDGDRGMGQPIAKQAVEFALDRAQETGCYIVALRNAGHVGRVGAWAMMAADAGYVSIHFVNAAGSVLVAPFGGIDRRFSTAPFCVGVPRPDAPPVILDFATSVVSEGKVMVAAKGGKTLPDGALIDGNGKLTTGPEALYGDAGPDAPPHRRTGNGAIRAFGDHKGSGLALICELLGGALTGNGTTGKPNQKFANGMLSIYVSADAMDDRGGFANEVNEYVKFVTSATPIDSEQPVLAPGEPERARTAERLKSGITLPDDAWAAIQATARKLGMSDAEIFEWGGDTRSRRKLITRSCRYHEVKISVAELPTTATRCNC